MLREGILDISPSSSIEYIRNKNRYHILPWFSISSLGPINSIFLFSRLPLDELEGKKIAVSYESETSTVLLKIILKEFFSIKSEFVPVNRRSVNGLLSSFSAVLHIGDTAMTEAQKLSLPSSSMRYNRGLYVYDLGELWDNHTGLPFVFALWVVRKKILSLKKDLIEQLSGDLMNANRFAAKNYSLIAKDAPHNKWLGEKELVDYWKTISYDLTKKHLEGLALFERYAKKCDDSSY
jgi:chorismate dehydratase